LLADPHLVAGAQAETATQLCRQHQPASLIEPCYPTYLSNAGVLYQRPTAGDEWEGKGWRSARAAAAAATGWMPTTRRDVA